VTLAKVKGKASLAYGPEEGVCDMMTEPKVDVFRDGSGEVMTVTSTGGSELVVWGCGHSWAQSWTVGPVSRPSVCPVCAVSDD